MGSVYSRFADRLVNQCLRVTNKDTVTILTTPSGIDLAEEIALACFRVGADALLNLYTDKYYAGYLRLLPTESLREPSKFCVALTECSTVEVFLGDADDPTIFRNIAQEKIAAAGEGEGKAHWPLTKERKIRIANVRLGRVTRQRARAYRFEHAAWKRMMLQASYVDYSKMAQLGKALATRLQTARIVRITAPNGTDLTLKLAQRPIYVQAGVIDDEDIAASRLSVDIPAGDVQVAPVEASGDGTVIFDMPMLYLGQAIQGVRWSIKNGRVVEFAGERGVEHVRALWEKASGDKDRIGRLAFGINPKARLGYTVDNIALGAVTVGIGFNEDIGGQNKGAQAFSATLSTATVELDGETIIREGSYLV